MPTQENGQAGLVNQPRRSSHFSAISSTSNTAPIVVTTSAPHLLTTGDTVWNIGANDDAANGVFIVNVTGASTFELVGSTADGGGGAAGLVYILGFDSTFQIPSDGDTRDAASVDVALEALADRTAWLASKVGVYNYPFYDQFLYNDDDTGASWSTNGSLSASYAFVANSPQMPFTVAQNDQIEIDFDTLAIFGTPKPGASLALGYTMNGGAVTKIPGSGISLNQFSLNDVAPVSLLGRILAPTAGAMVLGVIVKDGSPTGDSINLLGDYTFAGRQWRQV